MIGILLLGAIYLFHDSMSLAPAHVHSWTQSDRLAIAMNFQDNGFDFFHPATYNLLTKDGITQVDFPIHDYLIALISFVSGMEISFTFRLYNLCFFLLGLFFFFRACRLLNIDSVISISITLFVGTLPFLVYYQNGFLPSIPSLASFFIGMYFMIKSFNLGNVKAYYVGITFFTIAALARIPFTVFLIALIGTLTFPIIKGRRIDWKKIFPPLIGLLMVIAYFFYNRQLADEYGSMFLSSFRTAESSSDLWQTIQASMERWSGQLLSPFHWLIVIALIALYFKQKKGVQSSDRDRFLKVFTLISLIGMLCYFILMSLQFIDHDYYYIDSLLPILCFVAIYGLRGKAVSEKWYSASAAFLFITGLSMFSYAKSNQDYRYGSSEEGRVNYHYQVFERSANDLESWGVKKEDTLAVFDISSTNLPFISWQQKGYTSLSSGENQAKELLAKPFDYAFLIDSFKVSDSYFDYPDLAKQLQYLNGNGEISIYRKNTSSTIDQFFKVLYAHSRLDFEDNLKTKDLVINEGAQRSMIDDMKGNSLKLSDQSEFALTAEYTDSTVHKMDAKISLKFDFHPLDSSKGLQLVISSANYHYAFYMENEIEEQNYWHTHQFHRRIPAKYLNNEGPLKIYFWNPDGSVAYIDNYEILIYE